MSLFKLEGNSLSSLVLMFALHHFTWLNVFQVRSKNCQHINDFSEGPVLSVLRCYAHTFYHSLTSK